MKPKNIKPLKIQALKEAVGKFKTQQEFANQLPKLNKRKPDQRDVAKWLKTGLPTKWAIPVEKVSGVSRHKLAPEIYPNE